MDQKLIQLLVLLLIGAWGCQKAPFEASLTEKWTQKEAISSKGMVVTAHPEATRVGVEILERGGNAFDAAIAVQYALAVVHPEAGNIGGGGFLVLRDHAGKVNSLDFRETAPQASYAEMYLNDAGQVRHGLSLSGHLAAGVPGTVAGMEELHRKYGSLPMETLVEPAVSQAQRGFRITESQATTFNKFGPEFRRYNGPEFSLCKEEPWKAGDVLKQEDLARTLSLIAENGATAFYKGEIAELIIAEMDSGNGNISRQDLAAYQPVWRIPLQGKFHGYGVITMPPPSGGGLALLQLLQILETYPLERWGPASVKTVHHVAEAEKRVFADRAQYVGDPDFVNIPLSALLDTSFLRHRMSDVNPDSASRTDQKPGVLPLPAKGETTHYSIVDAEGNAVSVTTTLNTKFGCKTAVDKAGFLLNNEMNDFDLGARHPVFARLISSEVNAIKGGKRMLSSMTPTILEKDGAFYLATGAPGGTSIISSVLHVLLNHIVFSDPLPQAVWRPRYHHNWIPNVIQFEKEGIPNPAYDSLRMMGHGLLPGGTMGSANSIVRVSGGELLGVGDKRLDDAAMGLE